MTYKQALARSYADVRARLFAGPKLVRVEALPEPEPPEPEPEPAVVERDDTEVLIRLRNPFNQLWQNIVNEVAEKHGICAGDIMGKSRRRDIYAARKEAIMRIWDEVRMHDGSRPSLPVIGRWFQRDHTTILYTLGHLVKPYDRRRRQ